MDLGRDRIADPAGALNFYAVFRRFFSGKHIFCRILSGLGGFLGDIIYQIVDVQHVSGGEYPRNPRLQPFIHQRPAGDGA